MKIELNNTEYEITEGYTLSNLREILELQPLGIAFAVENKVIKQTEWDKFVLMEGMKVMMIKAVGGG